MDGIETHAKDHLAFLPLPTGRGAMTRTVPPNHFATRSVVRWICALCSWTARATLRASAARMICSCSVVSLRAGSFEVIDKAM
jgi:hypothetical protein